MNDPSRFSIVGNSIRLTIEFFGDVVDAEIGTLDQDGTPTLPSAPNHLNDELIVSMGCPKLDREPVTAEDLAACREWLDAQGFIRVIRTH